MKKSLKIIGIVLGIIAVLFILACLWVSGLKDDQEQTKETVKVIVDSYENFNNRVEEFSTLRNQFYELRDDLYLETLAQNSNEWNKFMKEYAESIDEVEKASKGLKENCHIKYGDVNANSKCTAFKANYEAAQNYYISDVKMYNSLVDEYNKWNSEQSKKYPSVEKGTFPVYKKYIDYDKDGEYFGKEEVKKDAE